MFQWYKDFRRAGEVRQLNRDAPAIIKHANELFMPKALTDIADLIRDHLDRAYRQYGTKTVDLQRAHFDYKRLHKEARRRGEQANLSGLTLTIIYLRAEIAGKGTEPAREAIDDFVNEHASPETGST